MILSVNCTNAVHRIIPIHLKIRGLFVNFPKWRTLVSVLACVFFGHRASRFLEGGAGSNFNYKTLAMKLDMARRKAKWRFFAFW